MRGQPRVLGVRRPQATKEGWALGLIYHLANTLRPQNRDLPDPN